MTTNFSIFETKISDYLTSNETMHSISGIKPDQFLFLAQRILAKNSKNTLVIMKDDIEVDKIYSFALSLGTWQKDQVFKIYGDSSELYDGMFPSENKFHETLKNEASYHLLEKRDPSIIICTPESLVKKYPVKSIYQENSFTIEKGSNFDPDEIVEFLVDLGYFPSNDIDEPGSFINKGEVIDIYPINSTPVRIYFDLDVIEKIKFLSAIDDDKDPSTDFVQITFAPNYIMSGKFGENLKKNIPTYNLEKKDLLLSRREILTKINQNLPFQNFQYFYSCAFNEFENIYQFFNVDLIINSAKEENLQKLELLIDDLKNINILEFDQVLPEPSKIFFLNQPTEDSIKTVSLDTFSIDLGNEIETNSSVENLADWIQKNKDINTKIENAG